MRTLAPRSPAGARVILNQPRGQTAAIRHLLHAPRPQTKLTVGAPGDAFEREADQVADHVMRTSETGVQRMCHECEEELQAREEPGRTPSVPEGFEQRFAALQGGGEPLPASERAFFEPRFGRDFANVRLHSGPAADELARSVHARAFTLGNSIVLGSGQYGRQLLAHELTHTVQQGAAGELRRKPKRPEDDPIHQPSLEQFRREEGLPESGIDPQTGQPVGPSPAAIKYGPWPGDVAAPKSTPSLAAVPEALPVASCGTATTGDVAKDTQIRDCIYHARFVNIMNQSIANIAQVGSPYAPGIAAVYQAALAEVVKAGLTSPPTEKTPKTYTVKSLIVTVSPGITLPIASFDLKLFREPNGLNGAATGTGIDLNEVSDKALVQDQPDIERTIYHEGFHWLSGEVSNHNRQIRKGFTKGTIVRPELDSTFSDLFEAEFRTAAEPIWKDALATLEFKPLAPPGREPKTLAGVQWSKVENEILSRVEEAVYLSLREGRGFSRRFDLPALEQGWLLTPEYWDSGLYFVHFHFAKFLSTNKDRINRKLLPVVQKIQREYLKRRAQP